MSLLRGFNASPRLRRQADRPPTLVSSPCVRVTASDGSLTDAKASVPGSPQPPAAESLDCVEDRADGGVLEASLEVSSSADTCASSFPGWIKSPDRGLTGPAGLNFSPVNSNLRDLTPSHTLEPLAAPFRPEAAAGAAAASAAGAGPMVAAPAAFSEGQGALFYPGSEDAGLLAFSRSLNVEGSGDGGGSAQNPPQKKKVTTEDEFDLSFMSDKYLKEHFQFDPTTRCRPLSAGHGTAPSLSSFPFQVSLLEYRKRQREARRSGSKTECSSPVSTVPPLTVDAFPVGLESGGEAPAPTAPCGASAPKEPQANEESDAAGERGEKEEGQW